ncbi:MULTISPECIES: type II toxin-antitoxin system HicB family antitoxin [unclassified Paenibacillus]|uniref:type II toxin-antitoxin system HicB family antitoxin n=1 Tax=unclassified Paenibacillus TaxID=185978 RepID=UPI000954B037|nr:MULTISPECIES: type II toxin-antitoxin system HicB family antitoxin [unclassified Paenibacillus]ASS66360.1 type II toxin-antitoxin system HicB family antitoxin [Paenibacillus sp. RUD330]SIQ06750.1 HicB family protein [Paenibacillus sp. RU4X]SIQ26847.1 HicB family protein [Paenibacillus sp. RU4T]
MEKKKDLNYYLSLPYTFQVRLEPDENEPYYYANVKELDGCHTTAATWAEAYEELQTVLKDHIEIKLEYGDPIPEPQDDFSGKILLRLPKSLHRELISRANQEGTSLNQYLLYKLSR